MSAPPGEMLDEPTASSRMRRVMCVSVKCLPACDGGYLFLPVEAYKDPPMISERLIHRRVSERGKGALRVKIIPLTHGARSMIPGVYMEEDPVQLMGPFDLTGAYPKRRYQL